jgi:multidrug efflux pump subunit AcrA (membrane-fusion protein)
MRVQNRTRGSLEEEAEMLPQEPPPFVVRGAAWLFIVLFFTVVTAAVVVRVPETVRCPFVLVPKDGADPIQASSLVVVREVRVTEGQEVAEGDELFILQSDDVRSRRTQLQTLTEELQTREKSCTNIEASYAAQLGIKQAEITQVERELVFRRKHAETIRGLVARLEKLALTGGISQIELAKYQLELAGSEKDLSVTEKTLEGVKLERERLETDRARQRAEEQSVMQNLKVHIAALGRDLENAREDLLAIRAPYASMVISLAQRNAGQCRAIRPGALPTRAPRCRSARTASLAGARTFPARPRPACAAILRSLSLPALRHHSRADSIGSAPPPWRPTTAPGSSALASLDQTSISVKGEPRPLRVGMKGEARVIVGNRRLIEYALEPVRKLREDMKP